MNISYGPTKAKGPWYVGYKGGDMVMFRLDRGIEPTAMTTPQYAAVIGPFRSARGAAAMAFLGRGNPHMLTVADAERIGKEIGLHYDAKRGWIYPTRD